MRGKSNQNQEEENFEEDEFRKDGPSSNNANNNTSKVGKNTDKASAIRSKHSVTEQRRRSKINERFQILRDLIPHSDQKRDTASFLLEVIEYVQYLQEKAQKYDGSYQGWSPEPTKLMPWRNSHWRVQGFAGQPQAIKNDTGPGSIFGGKFDENNISMSPTLLTSTENLVESDPSRDAACKTMEQSDLASKGIPSVPFQTNMTGPRSDGVGTHVTHPHQQQVSGVQTAEFPVTSNALNPQEELTIEGGTISISSVYSQGLLNNLTQALQSAGVDLSQAKISVQIDLGKRAHRELMTNTSTTKEPLNPPPSTNQAITCPSDVNSGESFDQVQKRLKS